MKVFDKIDVFNSIVAKVYPDIVEIQVADDHKDEIAYTNLSYEEWDTLVAAVAKARGIMYDRKRFRYTQIHIEAMSTRLGLYMHGF